MSSKRAEPAAYSLTQSLAKRFAITTCGLIALYALLSALFVFDQMRQDLVLMLKHETEELAANVTQSDGTHEAFVDALQRIAQITAEPPTAFRLRGPDNEILAESGEAALLRFVTVPLRRGR